MRFGLFYELQLPRPWDERSEYRVVHEALEQVELADRLGFDSVWAVEHHFLEEYSQCSAPEVFLAAASQRTKHLRIGHGIVALPPAINHPARVAERIGMLDLVSHGRVEFGTGESASDMELRGFGIERAEKRAMWEEGLDAVIRLMTEEPFTGVDGKYVTMPPRNVVPKPFQKPHPPISVACSRRDTITMAARKGIGALSFSFIEHAEAKEWVDHYYSTLENEGIPAGKAVNANISVVTGFFCAEDEQVAIDKGIDGTHFFSYSLAHYCLAGDHSPAKTDVWEDFLANREAAGLSKELIKAAGLSLTAKVKLEETERAKEEAAGLDRGSLSSIRGAVGTPDQVREFLRGYEEAGIDEVIFIAQAGTTKHEDICESLELFAREVMPEFKERAEKREKDKQQRLAPVVEKIMARRPATDHPMDPDYSVPAIPPGQKFSY